MKAVSVEDVKEQIQEQPQEPVNIKSRDSADMGGDGGRNRGKRGDNFVGDNGGTDKINRIQFRGWKCLE